MSAATKKKFVVLIERVEKTIREVVVESDSAMTAYDEQQEIVDKFNEVLSRATPIGAQPDVTRSVQYHISKIEEVKE